MLVDEFPELTVLYVPFDAITVEKEDLEKRGYLLGGLLLSWVDNVRIQVRH